MTSKLFFKAIGNLCLLVSKYLLAPLDAKVLAVGTWAASKAGSPTSTNDPDRRPQ